MSWRGCAGARPPTRPTDDMLVPPLRDNTPHHHNAQQGQCGIGRGTTLARGKEEAIWTGSTEPLTTYFRGTACRSPTFSMTCPSGAAGWCWDERRQVKKCIEQRPTGPWVGDPRGCKTNKGRGGRRRGPGSETPVRCDAIEPNLEAMRYKRRK